jgi:N-formylglutamate amidohydrolase
MMLTLYENEVLANIAHEQCFEAMVKENNLIVKITNYVPAICTAIHDGHLLRDSLVPLCLLSEEERFYEEDPFTGACIAAQNITLIAQDSRYEYDLNRDLDRCVYDVAWEKTVWSTPLSATELAISWEKHRCYYRILAALLSKLEAKFSACVLYDLHSYNYQRIPADTPTFNLGTTQIDKTRWQAQIDHFMQQLNAIKLPALPVRVAENEVFQGKAYQARFVRENFKHSLVLPLEIKKVFMDELSGECFPERLAAVKQGLSAAITENIGYFICGGDLSRPHKT